MSTLHHRSLVDENRIIRIPRPPRDPEAEKNRPPPYNPETAESIFRGLHSSGEYFYEYKKRLENVRQDIVAFKRSADNSILESEKHLNTLIKINSDFNIKSPRNIEHRIRIECSPEEEKIINQACQATSNSSAQEEDIKYALGYKSSDERKSEFCRPCVACVGQIKAGKSSVINCILKERTVPQRTTRLTARITTITYSDTKFVAHVGLDRKLQSLELDQDCRVKDVELPYQERLDKEKVNVEVKVGRKNKILKNGFDLIDSPGLNENEILNNLCGTMEKSLMPLIIYVICGRQGVTESDVKDIKKMKERSPQLRIIYYVTKLDRSKYDKLQYEDWRKEAKLGPGKHIDGESPIDVAHRRLKKVFRRLQTNGFLPTSNTWETCKEFFGASLHDVNAMRHFRPVDDPRTDIDRFNNAQFDRFERHLMLHLKDMIDSPLNEDIKFIQTSVESVLERLDMIMNTEMSKKDKTLQCVMTFKEKEQAVYESEIQSIKTDLAKNIKEMVDSNREQLFYVADWYEYSNSLRSNMINIKNNTDETVSRLILLRSYRREIIETIERCLNEQLKLLLQEFIVSKEEVLRKKLWEMSRNICQADLECPSFSFMLKNRLLYEYEFYEDMDIKDFDDCIYRSNEVVSSRITRIVNKFGKEIVSRASLTSDEDSKLPDPEETEWRKDATKAVLEGIDWKSVTSNVADRISELFSERHNNFQRELKQITEFIELDINVSQGEEEREYLKEYSENLRVQSMICEDTHTSINMIINDLKIPQQIVNSDTFKISKMFRINITQDIPILKKVFEKNIDFQSSEFKEKICREIYFASRILMPQFVDFLGAEFLQLGDGNCNLALYYPFTEENTLMQYVKSKDFDEKERLQIATQISEGIQILHGLQIIHGNLSINSVLIRENANGPPIAQIQDFGIDKYFSVANMRQVNAERLVCIAPEILHQPDKLTDKADTYAFGVLFWQLLTYRMKPEYDSVLPKYVIDDKDTDSQIIIQAILDGNRPEYRYGTPDQLWNVMQSCWQNEMEKRPQFITTTTTDKCPDMNISGILRTCL